MNIEIEKKFKVKNQKKLINWLEKNTEVLSKNSQEDILFTNDEFLSDRKILRLRREDGKEILTFKKLVFENNEFHHCDEFESEFKEENLQEIFKILSITTSKTIEDIQKMFGSIVDLEKSLNSSDFRSSYVINKVRQNYKYGSILLSLDNIKSLGEFLELEYLNNSYENALKDFNLVLTEIKEYLGDEVEKGYLDLLKEKIK